MTLSTEQAAEIGAHIHEALASARRVRDGFAGDDAERSDTIHNVIARLTAAIEVVRTCWCGEAHKEIVPPTPPAPAIGSRVELVARPREHGHGGAEPL